MAGIDSEKKKTPFTAFTCMCACVCSSVLCSMQIRKGPIPDDMLDEVKQKRQDLLGMSRPNFRVWI